MGAKPPGAEFTASWWSRPLIESLDLRAVLLNSRKGLSFLWRNARHPVMTLVEAEMFGLKDKDDVKVEVTEGPRPLTLDNVLVGARETWSRTRT